MTNHRKGETVYLFGTTYMSSSHYDDNPGGEATIIKKTFPSEWQNPNVAEYLVKIDGNEYLIPDVTIDETGSLKAEITKAKRKRVYRPKSKDKNKS